MLAGRDKKAEEYLNYFSPEGGEKIQFNEVLRQAILEGDRQAAAGRLKELLKDERPALDIINSAVIPALDRVGKEYNKKHIFLPQLIESAEVVEKVMGKIKLN